MTHHEQPDYCAYCPFEDRNHPFIEILKEMFKIYSYKNSLYADSYKIAAQMLDRPTIEVLLARMIDKIMRACNILHKVDNNDINNESLKDTLIDLAIYAVLAIMSLQEYQNLKVEN